MPPPPSLRWTARCRHPTGVYLPAMLARIDDINGALIGLSRTWLIRDDHGFWRRRDRAMPGRAAGGAVRLAPAAETLMIGKESKPASPRCMPRRSQHGRRCRPPVW
jgi:hypothetical protein